MIVTEVAIGAVMTAITVTIHALFMAVLFERLRARRLRMDSGWRRSVLIVSVIVWFFLAIAAESWAWAALFYFVGAFQDMETAVYFTTVTYTTLGYGDIVLEPGLRLLGAFAAANGTIVIGWTTALVFLVVQQVYGLHFVTESAAKHPGADAGRGRRRRR